MLSGKKTSLFDFPFFGKFIFSGTKFDVAPELITYFVACHLSTRRVELVLLCWFLQCIHLLLFYGVGPSSSWLPGKCDLCLFYSIALSWLPHLNFLYGPLAPSGTLCKLPVGWMGVLLFL